MKTHADTNILVDDLHTLAHDASEIAQRKLVEPAQVKAQEVALAVKKKALEGQHALRRDRHRMETQIRRHPATTVGIAFGAGVLAGALVAAAITAGSADDSEHGFESRGV